MISQDALKQRLQALSASEFEPLPERGLRSLVDAMIANIGAPDPILRDDLIYSAFYHWISRDRLPIPILRRLFTTALDDQHLFYYTGLKDTETVFTRTFSVLVVALLLASHRRHPFLKPDEVKHAHERVLAYAAQERDFRGYTPDHGWAHAAAHTADALDELACCTELDAEDLTAVLVTIRSLAGNTVPYSHQEDERLSVAAVSVLAGGAIAPEALSAWIDSFLPMVDAPGVFPASYYRRINLIHFLRSLYFRLRRPTTELEPTIKATLLGHIDQVLAKITRF